MPSSIRSPWICQTCNKPILRSGGCIEVVNVNPEVAPIGSEPLRPSDDLDVRSGPNVKIIVYHHGKCHPYPGRQGYPITTNRAKTLADWCGWVMHMFDKSWMSRGDLERFLRFWWVNRGDDSHLLGP